MIRHISVFFIKESMKDQMDGLIETTRVCSSEVQAAAYVVGPNAAKLPEDAPKSADLPDFGDFVQILDFNTPAEAAAYPVHPAHLKLMKSIGHAVEKVTAIDVGI